MMKSDEAGFSKKNPDFVKSAILCPKMRFFGLFSKSALTILLISCQTVEEDDTDQQEKKLAQKIPYFSRYGLSKLGKISPFAMTSAWLIQHEFFWRNYHCFFIQFPRVINYRGTLHAFQIRIKWI